MKVLCVIPSRIASTRLPRKPLVMLGDKPMVQWTYEGAKQCPHITHLVVATDCEEIANVVRGFGGEVMITDPAIPTGSDRVAVVAASYPDVDVVINVQGDEPFIQGEMLSILLEPFCSGEMPEMATIGYPLNFERAYSSPDSVKVIYDQQGYALYFSRSPLPYMRTKVNTAELPVLNHMGIYAFRRDFLDIYPRLPQTKLELAESLEQLRVLEHGYRIKVCKVNHSTLEINTPEELALARERIKTL